MVLSGVVGLSAFRAKCSIGFLYDNQPPATLRLQCFYHAYLILQGIEEDHFDPQPGMVDHGEEALPAEDFTI